MRPSAACMDLPAASPQPYVAVWLYLPIVIWYGEDPIDWC